MINFSFLLFCVSCLTFLGSAILVRELWLGNLPENLSDKKLKNTVEMFGDVENIEYYNKVRYHQVKFTTSLKEALLS